MPDTDRTSFDAVPNTDSDKAVVHSNGLPSESVEGPTADIPGDDDPGMGRRLAFDVGKVRIGVASCDPQCVLATPVTTVQRPRKQGSRTEDIREIAALIAEYEPVELLVGLPRTLKNQAGSSVAMVEEFSAWIRELYPDIPLRYVDERLTTVVATQELRSAGVPGRKQRAVVDQAAAVGVMQFWLDLRKRLSPPEDR